MFPGVRLPLVLVLVVLAPVTSTINPGVKVQLTQKGLEYGRQLGMVQIRQRLQTINIPDMSGSQKVPPIGKVHYTLSNMHIVNVDLGTSGLGLVPGTGVRLSIENAFINLSGNWKVRYMGFIKDHGSFDLKVKGLTIGTTIIIHSDETGRPVVSSTSCTASVGGADIKFHGGASWLYNLFGTFIDKALRSTLQKQLCPLVSDAITDLNPELKTLNVMAKVDQFAEIEYSMVSSPNVSKSSIDFSLKGVFYNIRKHQEPPFSPAPFSLPPQINGMLYIGMSTYTVNTAAFVYNSAGALSLYITDDMIPAGFPIRLNTKTFGAFIPQLPQRFPGLMMKLLVKTAKTPLISFQPNNATVQANGTVTAYAIQPNATLTPLFVLNLETSVSARVFVSGMRVAGAVTLNKMDLTLGTSYIGDFQVKSLNNILQTVVKFVVIPKFNAQLAKGYPLPTFGKMKLINTELKVLKDFMLIGTDVQFTP